MLPEGSQGEQTAGRFLSVWKTDESTQTDVGQTVLQVFGGGCAELSDKKEKELKLLELIEDGMALITPESPVLTGYQYDWAYEEECDFPRWEWKARSYWSILLMIHWRSVSRGI